MGPCAHGFGTRNEQSTALVRPALDELTFGFAVFDGDLRLVTCNKAFGRLRDYPATLCRPGTEIAAFYRFNAERGDYGEGDPEAEVRTRIRKARSRKRRELEYELATGRMLSIRYAPIAPDGLLLSYADVTKRRRAEEALRESEERYALALEGANEGMWDWSAGSDEIIVSDSYKRITLLEIPGDRLALTAWRGMIHPEDLADHDAARNAHFTGETPFYECEYRVRCGDGAYRWFLDRARGLRDATGAVSRMLGSMTDITARKKAELELLEANRRIGEQNHMLESLSEQLSKYLSPQLYALIFSGEQTVEISSRRKRLTILFSDIVDFTAITESLEPEELTRLLNNYLTEMSRIALDYGATIDKYFGDAILCFFGDPESRGARQDAAACVSMAIAMQRRLRQLRDAWQDRGLEKPLEVRIGISTGFCTVGNFGSEDRMDYTIIGSPVNLAARLQAHAPPGGILLAHKTYSLVRDTVMAEELEAITVKGFARPVQTHRVVGLYDDLAAEGRVIRKEAEGLHVLVDLGKRDKNSSIAVIEEVLASLRG